MAKKQFKLNFEHENQAPTSSFMENFVKVEAGYSDATKIATVRWEISTNDTQENIEHNFATTIANHGTYTNGKLTSVGVTKK